MNDLGYTLKQGLLQSADASLWQVRLIFEFMRAPPGQKVQNLSDDPFAPFKISPDQIYLTTGTWRASSELKIQYIQWMRDVPATLQVWCQPPANPRVEKLFVEVSANAVPRWAHHRTVIDLCVDTPGTSHLLAVEDGDEPDVHPDYLQKDYASIRSGLLEKLRTLKPDWEGEGAADIGVMIVEVLAYAADYLSYAQDAVATEAYLATARRRTSLIRHGRLLGYRTAPPRNARSYVSIEVKSALDLPKGTAFASHAGDRAVTAMSDIRLQDVIQDRVGIYESCLPARLEPELNVLHIKTWGEERMVIPKGATQLDLIDQDVGETKYGVPIRRLDKLRVGDVICLVQRDHSLDGSWVFRRSHAVRIVELKRSDLAAPSFDPWVEITWSDADALPFDLLVCDTVDGRASGQLALGYGNCVLVDFGATVHMNLPRPLPQLPYAPRWEWQDITYALPKLPEFLERDAAQIVLDPPDGISRPDMSLVSIFEPNTLAHRPSDSNLPLSAWPQIGPGPHTPHALPESRWAPRADLLSSRAYDRHFVVEDQPEVGLSLRFGDGTLGAVPQAGAEMRLTYRLGSGGNIGAQSITTMLAGSIEAQMRLSQIVASITNPVPATGARAGDTKEAIRSRAPMAHRVPQTCGTENATIAIALRDPDVIEAAVRVQDLPGVPLLEVAVVRANGPSDDREFLRRISKSLALHRVIGTEIAVHGVRRVPLYVQLEFRAHPGHATGLVQANLVAAFTAPSGGDAPAGYFDPSQWSMGETVYASDIIGFAKTVDGVADVELLRFGILGQEPHGARLSQVSMGYDEKPQVTEGAGVFGVRPFGPAAAVLDAEG